MPVKKQQKPPKQPEQTADAKPKKKLLVVDDHPLVRERVAELINQEPDLLVCGEASDANEALAAANAGEFGLSAGIMTNSLKYARHFVRNVRAGMVMTNLPTAGVDYHVPFGGTRKSSFGPREQGFAAVEFYTQVKTSYTWA